MPLAEEDKTEVKTIVQDAINGIVGNLKKTFDLARQKDGETLKGDLAKLLEDKLKDLRPADPPPGDDGGGKGGKGKDIQVSTLQKRIDDLEKSTRESNDRASKAEKRRREVERQNVLDGHLAKGGVSDPFMRELAIAHFDRRGYVPLEDGADSNDLVWRGSDGVDVSFEEGIGSWMKTDEAKRFLPPTGAGGSGGRRPPVARPPAAKKDVSYEDVGNFVLGLAGQQTQRSE